MKKYITLLSCVLIVFLIVGCCNLPKDESLKSDIRLGKFESKPKTIIVENNEHYIACRANYDDENEKKLVDKIISKVSDSSANVVLYFHGGLSSQKYVMENLGPDLMKSVFQKDPFKKQLYPIFLNYDAEPDLNSFPQFRDSEVALKIMKEEPFDGLLSPDEKRLLFVDGLEEKVPTAGYQKVIQTTVVALSQGADSDLSLRSLQTMRPAEISLLARKAIYRLSGKDLMQVKGLADEEQSEDQAAYLTSILTAKKLPKEFNNENIDKLIGGGHQVINNDLATLADEMKVKGLTPTSLNDENFKLRIIRIVARFALGNDHGFPATIQEEYLDVIFNYLGGGESLAQGHWNKVKRHAKQCFSEGSNGRKLIDELLKLKAVKGTQINTLSHSAGSIPTAQLITYLSGMGQKIGNVVMVVPAINQETFNQLVIDTNQPFNSIYVYALRESYEKNDNVASNWLYSASLLYGVSSMGEVGNMLDKMLLIDQHMSQDRAPYKYKIYKCAACEKPESVWTYFEEGKKNGKAVFRTYPFPSTTEIAKGAATHEGTKYPWLSSDLAKEVFNKYGVDTSSVDFKIP